MGTSILQAIHQLHNLALLPLVVAIVGGLPRYYRLPLGLRYLLAAAGWSLVVEVVANLLYLRRVPNLFLIPIDSTGELTLLALSYQQALRSATLNRWLPAGLAGFAALALATGLSAPQVVEFKPWLKITEDSLLLLLVVSYFRKLLNELVVKHLENEAMFWVSASLFVYCLGDILIALFSNYLLQRYSRQLNVNVWDVHALLVFLLNSSYALALWMRPPK